MKVSKTQCLLYMYELLVENEKFSRDEVISKLEIPPLTFHRYVQELKAYLSNFGSNKELVYSRNEKKYRLMER